MGRVASGVRDLRSASDVVGCSVYEEVESEENDMSHNYGLREDGFEPGTLINISLHAPRDKGVMRGWRRMGHIDEVTPGNRVRVKVRSRQKTFLWEGEVSLLVEMVDYYLIFLKGMADPVTFDIGFGTEVFVLDEYSITCDHRTLDPMQGMLY